MPIPNPTRPQTCEATLADQLAGHRIAVTRIAALLLGRPSTDRARIDHLAERAAQALGDLEAIAR